MRVFKNGENILETDDEVLAKAILNSGYIEIVKTTEETEVVKPPKKRSRVEVD